ncbi:hypothetical protein ACE1OE_15285 [Vibrio sp. E150_011]
MTRLVHTMSIMEIGHYYCAQEAAPRVNKQDLALRVTSAVITTLLNSWLYYKSFSLAG